MQKFIIIFIVSLLVAPLVFLIYILLQLLRMPFAEIWPYINDVDFITSLFWTQFIINIPVFSLSYALHTGKLDYFLVPIFSSLMAIIINVILYFTTLAHQYDNVVEIGCLTGGCFFGGALNEGVIILFCVIIGTVISSLIFIAIIHQERRA